MPEPTTIVLFRQDLRVDDHPALVSAARRGRVVPVYVQDPSGGDGNPDMGGASRWWLHHSLASLGARLEGLGSGLSLRIGEVGAELRSVARRTGADRVCLTESVVPAVQDRDEDLEHGLNQDGIEVERHPANLLWPVGGVLTRAGEPYQVFTPFWKTALASGEPESPVDAPASLTPPGRVPASVGLEALGLLPEVDWAAGMRSRWTPGERGAVERLDAFIDERLDGYHEGRDRLDVPGWSAMSPHLHFGEVSVRRLWHAVAGGSDWGRDAGREHYLREVGWREFAQHLLNHFPRTPGEALRPKFSRFPWLDDGDGLRAWQRGRTGYPVVDAAMRNLWHEGWMPNRARMIVASFLCKDLLISWERGAAWFLDTLVDADLGSNTLGWQWTAGCGADAAPFFRIFNPVSQGEKFDPEGAYVRRWVPELGGLGDRMIHKPWEASPMELAAAGVTLGEDYPEPIVDHKAARARALAAFERIKG